MGVLKKLASDTALYGVSSILGRVIGYLLVPLHTAVFGPGPLAEQVTYFLWVALLNVIYVFGMETTFFRFASREKDRFQEFYNLSITAILTVSCIGSGMIILLSSSIAEEFGYPGRGQLVSWLAIIMVIDALVAIPYARIRLTSARACIERLAGTYDGQSVERAAQLSRPGPPASFATKRAPGASPELFVTAMSAQTRFPLRCTVTK